ncbi:hypothetical protein [Aquimarina sp. SS2-1]|uniref:hypothetical protein n=1 Tax=Aquimarina besae TaxID=3342247 RepID=UPI003670FCA7
MKNVWGYIVLTIVSISSCSNNENSDVGTNNPTTETTAVVSNVSVTGEENNYTFSVEIKSPDQGCNQYADWWEVISEEGMLLYRRILAHSHVNEQPFTRSGGPINITKDQIVYIRAHMNNKGYGNIVFKGSVSTGFSQETIEITFANELETAEPLPNGCAF